MTAKAPKTIANSSKIEPKDLRILFLMLFCRSSFLNDSTTIFMVFHVLEVPWKTINPPKLIPIITSKLRIDKTPSKARFVSKNYVSSHLKLHPKSLKVEVGSPRRSSWRSEGPAEFFKASPGSQKVTPNLFQALPIQQKRTQNHKSRGGAGGRGRSP